MASSLRVKNLGWDGYRQSRQLHELWRKEVLSMVGDPIFEAFLSQKDLSQYNYFFNFMLRHLCQMPVDNRPARDIEKELRR